jgi:glutamate-1-semialdehyde 2,1-aminomutase
VLIFDEVMTGFRVGRGGAQQRYCVRPDLTTAGKIIGGGLPVGAYGGRADLMALVAPEGPIYQAGTLSGNPLSMAAGLATLRTIDGDGEFYERLEASGARLERGLVQAALDVGVEAHVSRVGSMWTLFFSRSPVRDWASASLCDRASYARFFHGMLAQGIALAPSQFEANFISAAHSADAIDATIAAAGVALGMVRG